MTTRVNAFCKLRVHPEAFKASCNPKAAALVEKEISVFSQEVAVLSLTRMKQGLSKVATYFGKALVILGLVFTPLSFVAGLQNNQTKKPVSTEPDKGDDTEGPISEMEAEMRAKRAIKYAEKEYQENLDRARDLSSLGSSIVNSFKQKKALDQDDIKKLEKVEKLAKGIRRAAGGSEDDIEMEKPPTDMAAAMEMLGCLSQSLKAKVEKTPKHVISAAVIDEANVLLELIRIVRNLPSKV